MLPALVPPDPRACEEPLTQASGCDLGGQPRGRGTALLQGGASAGQGHRAGPATWGDKALRGMLALRGHHLAAVSRTNRIILQVAFSASNIFCNAGELSLTILH